MGIETIRALDPVDFYNGIPLSKNIRPRNCVICKHRLSAYNHSKTCFSGKCSLELLKREDRKAQEKNLKSKRKYRRKLRGE